MRHPSAWVLVLAGCLLPARVGEAEGDRAPKSSVGPLYLLTYDHGGLVLWGHDHFAAKLREAVQWLDRYPSFKIGLDNEAWTYDELAATDRPLLAELREDLARYRGRLGVGTCTYGQPLSTFIGGESNIRQVAYAVRADREHLGVTPSVYLMSEHAMHSQMPQILDGFGFSAAIMRTHYMMYGYNPTFDLPVGQWVGLDGSRLPAVPTYVGEGAEFGRTPVDNWVLTRCPGPECKGSLEEFRARFSRIRPLLATRADDSDLKREALVRKHEGDPGVRWILLEDLASMLPRTTEEMRTGPNDFAVRMPWGYCGNEIWDRGRAAEVQVLAAERLAAMERLLGRGGHEAELDTAWKNLLVAQHHDVQIVGLLPDARRFVSASMAASAGVRDAALRAIASSMKGEGFTQVTAVNPLPWPRREWIETSLSFGPGGPKALAVRQGSRTVPSTLLAAHRRSSGGLVEARVAFAADVPGLGAGAFSIVAADGAVPPPSPGVTVDAAGLRVLTPLVEARLDPQGGIASLVDRRTGRPLLAPGRRGGVLAGRIEGVDVESHGRWSLRAAGESVPWAVAAERGFVGPIPYTLRLTFRPDTPRIDARVELHFEGERIGLLSDDPRDAVSAFVHEHKLRFKLYPAVGERAVGVRDLPFAVAETGQRSVEGNDWTAVADAGGGVAFLNRGEMGSVREDDGAFSVALAFAMHYIWGTRMLEGDFAYEFAVLPFSGPWSDAALPQQALDYGFPLVTSAGPAGDGTLGEEARFLDVEGDGVLLSALYPEGDHVLARVFESRGRGATASIRSRRGRLSLREVDLRGREAGPVGETLPLRPWQFRTIRVDVAP
jgi:Glycosyl hydrolase family 57